MHLTQLKIYENVNKTFVSISEYIKSHSTEKENEQMKVEKKVQHCRYLDHTIADLMLCQKPDGRKFKA